MTTRFLPLAHHTSTGVLLSDATLRFVVMKQHMHSALPEHYGEVAVPQGCLDNGKIADRQRFISFLKSTRKAHKLNDVSIVLASAQIQTFSMSIKGAAPLYIKEALEKEFSLPAKDIAFEYKAVAGDEGATVFQVTAMPKIVSQDIATAFKSAGMTVNTIESVGHALNRDLLLPASRGTALIIAIDTTVTSLTFIVQGKVAHTVLLEFGDQMITKAIMKKLGVDEEEAERLKKEDGLVAQHAHAVFDAVVDDCAALVQHINEMYVAWRTAHKAIRPLEEIYLTGPGSVLRGLDEYIGVGLRLPVQEGNVWTNCLSFDDHVPVLPQSLAVRYAAAIGVVLAGGDTVNLLPYAHQQSLQRKRVASISGKIILSFILGVVVGFAVARAIAIPTVHTRIIDTLHKIQARW